jgi:ribosomal protein S12 methylthiotransferase
LTKYWFETLGCPKNQVDSDRLITQLEAKGLREANKVDEADVVVVNTCAFIDAAREESIETILELSELKADGAKLVVTGCLAQRYKSELADALPEVDIVAGFGEDFSASVAVGVTIGRKARGAEREAGARDDLPVMDLLRLPRRKASLPWSYVKVAEGCNKNCGFCSIPSFRGRQVSKSIEEIVAEILELEVKEAILVAQDLANYGADLYGRPYLETLYKTVQEVVPWVRLLYIYPTGLTESLIDMVAASPVPYFDLSLQHVSAQLLRRMKRVGSAKAVLSKIERIRSLRPEAVFRTSFILGYPGETEEDQEILRDFIEEAQLDWVGFFAFSHEEGTYAASLGDHIERSLAVERINELSEIQDRITRIKRMSLLGKEVSVLIDSEGKGRSFRETPEIDALCEVVGDAYVGSFIEGKVIDTNGLDLVVKWVKTL